MRSIFWRVMGVFWCALILTGILTFLATRLFNQDSWVLSQHPVLKDLSSQWLQHYSRADLAQAQEVLRQARHSYHISVQVFAEDGQMIAANGWGRNRRMQDMPEDNPSAWRRLTQEVVLNSEQNLLFVYRVPMPELTKWQMSRGLGPTTTLIIAILVITAASLLLTLSITRPLRRLRLAVHELGETAYQQSSLAQMAQRRDEFGVLATDFNRMGQRLQGMLSSQRQLLRDVSHELRSPLARLQIGLALAERATDEKREQLWPKLNHECRRLDELIDEILALARVAGEQLSLESVPLLPLLQELVEDASLLAPEQHIQLRCPEQLKLHTDARVLQRALDNLLRNALRFNPTGQPIEFSVAVQPDSRVQFKLRDHGPGAPAELLTQLAEPFVRASGQAANGYGLGLTITQRCVEQLGGSLQLANHPEGGFVASIILPIDNGL